MRLRHPAELKVNEGGNYVRFQPPLGGSVLAPGSPSCNCCCVDGRVRA